MNDKSRINKRDGDLVSSFLPFKSKLLHSVSFVIVSVPVIILRNAFQHGMGTTDYKYVALGLILLEYVSDAFEARQQELIALFRDVSDLDNICAMSSEDYYTEKNVFWVPKPHAWKL